MIYKLYSKAFRRLNRERWTKWQEKRFVDQMVAGAAQRAIVRSFREGTFKLIEERDGTGC